MAAFLRRLAVALAVTAPLACQGESAAPPDAGLQIASGRPDGEAPPEGELSDEVVDAGGPAWAQAASLDAIDLGRLAREVGARRLVEVARVAAPRRAVALAALPYATDGELALGRMCRIIGGGPPERREWLRALNGVIAALPPDAERLDMAGAKSCVPVLRWLASVHGVAAPDRDLAGASEASLLAWIGPP